MTFSLRLVLHAQCPDQLKTNKTCIGKGVDASPHPKQRTLYTLLVEPVNLFLLGIVMYTLCLEQYYDCLFQPLYTSW